MDSKLDVGKICQFATVYDLVEVYAGDTSSFADESKKATKEQREENALRKLWIGRAADATVDSCDCT